MKKITLGLFALAVATSANAKGNFEGWFVGAEINSTKHSLELDYVPYNYYYNRDDIPTSSNKKTGFAILGGYGFSFGSSDFVGQIETKYRTGGTTFSKDGHEFLKEKSVFQISYLQGYRLANNFLPYIKVTGAVHSFQGDGIAFNNDGGTFGGGAGIGLKYSVNENLEVGAEYLHIQLRDVGNDVKLKTNTIGLSASYRF